MLRSVTSTATGAEAAAEKQGACLGDLGARVLIHSLRTRLFVCLSARQFVVSARVARATGAIRGQPIGARIRRSCSIRRQQQWWRRWRWSAVVRAHWTGADARTDAHAGEGSSGAEPRGDPAAAAAATGAVCERRRGLSVRFVSFIVASAASAATTDACRALPRLPRIRRRSSSATAESVLPSRRRILSASLAVLDAAGILDRRVRAAQPLRLRFSRSCPR